MGSVNWKTSIKENIFYHLPGETIIVFFILLSKSCISNIFSFLWPLRLYNVLDNLICAILVLWINRSFSLVWYFQHLRNFTLLFFCFRVLLIGSLNLFNAVIIENSVLLLNRSLSIIAICERCTNVSCMVRISFATGILIYFLKIGVVDKPTVHKEFLNCH